MRCLPVPGLALGLALTLMLAPGLAMPGRALAAGSAIITGIGEDHCEAFNTLYAKDAAAARSTYYAWADGFLSGMNLIYVEANGRGLDIKTEEVAGQNEFFIRDYCQHNPTSTFAEAVVALSNTLDPGAAISK